MSSTREAQRRRRGHRSRHDVHLVRTLLLGGDDARRPDDHPRSVVLQSEQPEVAADGGPLRSAPRHARPLRPLRRRAHGRQPDPTDVAMHARDEPLAGAELRPQGLGHRHEQGRHGRGGGHQGHDGPRRPLGRRHLRRRRGADLLRRAGRLHRRARERVPVLLRRRHGRLRRHAAHRASDTDRSSPSCRSAATSRWIRPRPRSRSSCSA